MRKKERGGRGKGREGKGRGTGMGGKVQGVRGGEKGKGQGKGEGRKNLGGLGPPNFFSRTAPALQQLTKTLEVGRTQPKLTFSQTLLRYVRLISSQIRLSASVTFIHGACTRIGLKFSAIFLHHVIGQFVLKIWKEIKGVLHDSEIKMK